MEKTARNKAVFLIPSILGVILFMIPVKFQGTWTIVCKIISDAIAGVIGDYLPLLCVIILVISGVMALATKLLKPKFIMENELLKECFDCSWFWVIVRVLGAAFAVITFLELGYAQEAGIFYLISSPDQGAFILGDLLCTLVIIFVIAALLLPLLLDFGLLEFIGALCTKWMRPLFKVPGRAAVDCITSWIGDGTLGVMLTANQYEGGYYNAKEASIIATLFSAVSITFSLVVLDEVGLASYFGIYYILVCAVGIICAIICPYLWPLRKKSESYLVEGKAMPETLPDGFTSSTQYGWHLALKRASEQTGVGAFLKSGAKNALSMWFGVLPTVMAIGTVALILANHTPVFNWLGIPFTPIFKLFQIPEAEAAASTMIVGFTDMFTPAILIAGAGAPDITRFVVAVISITQVLYLSEVGGLILASKIPVNLPEMFVIFLERTLISIIVTCPIAHLIF